MNAYLYAAIAQVHEKLHALQTIEYNYQRAHENQKLNLQKPVFEYGGVWGVYEPAKKPVKHTHFNTN